MSASTYYIFQHQKSTAETGAIFPQVQKMSTGYDYSAPNSVHALSRYTETLPEFHPNFDSFVLHPKAKPTDVLSVSVIHGGFLISPKFKQILEKHQLPKHKFYDVKVLHKKEYYNYYWVHLIGNLFDKVDYKKSLFYVCLNYAQQLGYVEVLSKEDLILKKEKLKKDNPGRTVSIWSESIAMLESFKNPYDLFKIGVFDSNFYVTTSLKNEIVSNKLTGISINAATNLK